MTIIYRPNRLNRLKKAEQAEQAGRLNRLNKEDGVGFCGIKILNSITK